MKTVILFHGYPGGFKTCLSFYYTSVLVFAVMYDCLAIFFSYIFCIQKVLIVYLGGRLSRNCRGLRTIELLTLIFNITG